MAKELKEIPTFKNEEEEREFWASQDSTEYINWDEAEAVLQNHQTAIIGNQGLMISNMDKISNNHKWTTGKIDKIRNWVNSTRKVFVAYKSRIEHLEATKADKE